MEFGDLSLENNAEFWSIFLSTTFCMSHTVRKVKFLSKNSILSRVFHPNFFDNFSREIKVEFLDKK